MKVEGFMFGAGFVFLVIAAGVYGVLSGDPTGTTALLLSAGLMIIISSYLLFTGRRVGDRPEDRADAEISDGDPELGFFSPHSHWPIAMAAAATVAGLGAILDLWLAILGVVLLVWATLGLLFQYYVGADKVS